jgi:thiamine biosynthesis protein ThiS
MRSPAETEIEIHINGRARRVPESASVTTILALFDLKAATVVVEHNDEILPRERFGEVSVHAGDRLEIVRFVGGGAR